MRKFIKPLKKFTPYKEYYVFDVETTSDRCPKFLFAYVLKVDHSLKNPVQYVKGYDEPFYSPDELTEYFCLNDFRKKSRKVVFAHNLAFDFQFLNWNILTSYFKVNKFFDNPRYYVFYNNEERKRLVFIDTMNFFKASLEKLFPNDKIAFNFDNFNPDDKNQIELLKMRCRVDVRLTHRLVEKIKGGISASDMSFKIFRHEYRHYVQIIETPIAKNSYYGGRVEAFVTHKWIKGVRYYDFNSLYPSIMKDNKIPTHYVRSFHDLSVSELGALIGHDNLFVFADVSVDIPFMKISPCPFRLKNKLVFPVGTFRVCLAEPELNLIYPFIKRVHGVELYSAKVIFKDFVEKYYSLRLNSEGLDRDFYKLVLNSLYGKYGQREREGELVDVDKIGVERGFYFISVKHVDGVKRDYYVFGNMAFNHRVTDRHKYNVAVSSAITSYGRVKLYRKMLEVVNKGGQVFYCDTDSLFVDVDLESSKELGQLKLEGIGDFLAFKSKAYIFEGKPKFKGAREVNVNTLNPDVMEIVVQYKRFQTLKMGLRQGNYRQWLEVIKKFNLIDDKRTGIGDTDPLVLNEGVVIAKNRVVT